MFRCAVCGIFVAVAAVGTWGCSPRPATEIIVLVRVDPAIVLAPTRIAIDVRKPDGTLVTTEILTADLAGGEATLGIRHREGALSPLRVEARGTIGSDIVFDRAETSFVAGERHLLVLALHAACVAATCPDQATTCDPVGVCVSAGRPGASLPVFVDEGSFDASTPRDSGISPETGVAVDACLTATNCFAGESCEGGPSVRSCVSGGSSTAGDPCVMDRECESAVCGTVGGTAECARPCTRNSDCAVGVCVATERTGRDGACVLPMLSPCSACDGPTSACVVSRSPAAPTCTPRPLCDFGTACSSGETCRLIPESLGGQARCVTGGTCTAEEQSSLVLGIERCADGSDCDVADPFCSAGYPSCLPGWEAGLSSDVPGRLGLCVRSL